MSLTLRITIACGYTGLRTASGFRLGSSAEQKERALEILRIPELEDMSEEATPDFAIEIPAEALGKSLAARGSLFDAVDDPALRKALLDLRDHWAAHSGRPNLAVFAEMV